MPSTGGRDRRPILRPIVAALATVLLLQSIMAAARPAGARAGIPGPDGGEWRDASRARETVPAIGANAGAVFSLRTARAFTPGGDGPDGVVEAELVLDVAGTASVDVVSFDGLPVASLLPPIALPAGVPMTVRWDGAGVPDGPYRLRLSLVDASGAASTQELAVARVSRRASPTGVPPGTITVFLDPGHGGSDGGAEATAADGSLVREADLDLDIALRLAAMLRAAGVRVAMSRSGDVPANTPRQDRSGDGDIDGYDEFLARIDGANLVRADLFVAIHNNWIPDGRGRTEAFYCGEGCVGSGASRALAAAILDAHVARLGPLQTAEWQLTVGNPAIEEARRNPTDDVLRFGYATLPAGRHFYVLGPYHETFRPRAIQMPGVLMESLALSHPTELELLRRPDVRGLIAAAYYDGIAGWLSSRSFSVRLDPAGEPASPRAGRTTMLRVRVTNNGTSVIPAGSRVIVGSRPATLPYDGAFNSGSGIGSYVLRLPLGPGRSTVLPVPIRPRETGRATWKVDLVVDGARAAALRIPVLQYQVAVAR